MSVTSKIDAAVAAEARRDLDAQQLLLARRIDRGLWKAGFAVDLRGIVGRDGGDHRRALLQRGVALKQKLFAGMICGVMVGGLLVLPGLMHVHGRMTSRIFDANLFDVNQRRQLAPNPTTVALQALSQFQG